MFSQIHIRREDRNSQRFIWRDSPKSPIRTYIECKGILSQERDSLTVKYPVAPRIYGLPKLHKAGIPLRPIVSTINCPSYKLAKFVNQILKHLTTDSIYNTKNSSDFKNFVDNIQLENDDILVSFDIVSLFTNIPVETAIKEIEDRYDEIKEHTKIDKESFINLLRFVILDNNYFSFRGNIYKQKTGLAMGNPLSPIMADIVLEKLFVESLKNLTRKPTFIKKYVDDIVLAIPESEIEFTKTIFEMFNNNIKFTVEKENNNCLNFLDITLIHTEDNRIKTNWYQKLTSSGRILNFLSNHPFTMKRNVAQSLISKVLHLSDTQFQKTNLTKVRELLQINNYPRQLTEQLIHKIKNNHHRSPNIPVQNSQKSVYGALTYIPTLSDKIQKTIKKSNNLKIANKPTNKLSTIFTQLKDPIMTTKNYDVVYQFPCKCGKVYIGQTSQLLHKRLGRHKNDITNKVQHSAVACHYRENTHTYDFASAKIKHKESNEFKREFIEQCEIYLNNDITINKKMDYQQLNFHYRSVILYTYTRRTKMVKTKSK